MILPLLLVLASAPQDAPAGSTTPAKEKKTCRTDPAPTGSRLGATRRCKTAAGWAAEEASKPKVDISEQARRSGRSY